MKKCKYTSKLRLWVEFCNEVFCGEWYCNELNLGPIKSF
jgi:hypothetical protein